MKSVFFPQTCSNVTFVFTVQYSVFLVFHTGFRLQVVYTHVSTCFHPHHVGRILQTAHRLTHRSRLETARILISG